MYETMIEAADTLCMDCVHAQCELSEMPCKDGFYNYRLHSLPCPYHQKNTKENNNEDI